MRVIFRKFRSDGAIVAVFPDETFNNAGDLTSYMHIGQHGAISPFYADFTAPASPAEYEELLKELHSIGYNDIQIRKRR